MTPATLVQPQIKLTKHLIDGQWCDSADGKTLETFNPATAEMIAKVAAGDRADIYFSFFINKLIVNVIH